MFASLFPVLLAVSMFSFDLATGVIVQDPSTVGPVDGTIFTPDASSPLPVPASSVVSSDGVVSDGLLGDGVMDGGLDVPVLSGDVSPGDVLFAVPGDVFQVFYEAVVALASETTSALGTVNGTVLDIMDRIVDGLPPSHRYVAFRTSTSDGYLTNLYIAKRVSVNGKALTFSDDCLLVSFDRVTSGGVQYLRYYYTAVGASTVTVAGNTVVYTNCLPNYPILGRLVVPGSDFGFSLAFVFFGVVVAYVLFRRKSV
jgi:hypothetical protein